MIRRRNCQQVFLYNLLDLMVHRPIRDGEMTWGERFFLTNEFVGYWQPIPCGMVMWVG